MDFVKDETVSFFFNTPFIWVAVIGLFGLLTYELLFNKGRKKKN